MPDASMESRRASAGMLPVTAAWMAPTKPISSARVSRTPKW